MKKLATGLTLNIGLVLALSLLPALDRHAVSVVAAPADHGSVAGTGQEESASGIIYDFDFEAWQRTEPDSLRIAQVKALTENYRKTLDDYHQLNLKRADDKIMRLVTLVASLFLVLVFFLWKVIGQSGLKRRLEEKETLIREREAENLAILHQYFSNLSHEIRTPLNGITGMAELLSATTLSDKQEEYLNLLTVSTGNLMANVTDLIEFNRSGQPLSSVENRPFRLHDIIGQVVDMATEKATGKRIHLHVFTDTRIPPSVKGDPLLLRHVLGLLLRNAIQRSTGKEAGLKVEFIGQQKEFIELKFMISDSGTPWPDETLRNLSQSETKPTGLLDFLDQNEEARLRTAFHFIGLMHGTTGCESLPGDGVQLCFRLKFEITETRQVEAARMGLEGIRILLTDENHTSRSVFRQYLSYYGCRFDESAMVTDGLGQMMVQNHQIPYQIAIFNTKSIDVEDLHRISDFKSGPMGDHTKILLITSDGRLIPAAELRQYGIAAYLNKPVGLNDLYEVLASLIESQRIVEKQPNGAVTDSGSEGLVILLAEDNLISEKVAVATLHRMGHTVDVAENGKVVLQKLIEKRYDLILMDIEMPEMNGIEATLAIRKGQIGGRNGKAIKIIALTANAMPSDREKCLAAGMDGYISKPFRHEELVETLKINP